MLNKIFEDIEKFFNHALVIYSILIVLIAILVYSTAVISNIIVKNCFYNTLLMLIMANLDLQLIFHCMTLGRRE